MERIQKENHPKVGEDITITPKQLRLLQCLYKAHPEVLQRKDIVDFVWESKPTSPESLPQLINRTRIVLEDSNKDILVNEPGVGYSLNFKQSDNDNLTSINEQTIPNELFPPSREKRKEHTLLSKLVIPVCLGVTFWNLWSTAEAVYYANQFKKVFQAVPYPHMKPLDDNRIFIVIDDNECIYNKSTQILKCS
ncbi:hypothetical protein BIY22_18875 [Vibrio panuliri]|uniref:OmpR/PhoB-type domain-containing protein n=2 Tax=Vibrio panuliri TaxID=1381081 RepID=A0A1Q9HKT9_9VIBR|nr:hypothetical protein BIY22_18875 [Vibrio panuliri]